MNYELFAEDTTIETCFMAIVLLPDRVTCARRAHSTLYDAKIWITEKLFSYKSFGNSEQFPFGLDYCVCVESGIITSEQLGLL